VKRDLSPHICAGLAGFGLSWPSHRYFLSVSSPSLQSPQPIQPLLLQLLGGKDRKNGRFTKETLG